MAQSLNKRQRQIRRGNVIAWIYGVSFLLLTVAMFVGNLYHGHYLDAAVYTVFGLFGTAIGIGVIVANS